MYSSEVHACAHLASFPKGVYKLNINVCGVTFDNIIKMFTNNRGRMQKNSILA